MFGASRTIVAAILNAASAGPSSSARNKLAMMRDSHSIKVLLWIPTRDNPGQPSDQLSHPLESCRSSLCIPAYRQSPPSGIVANTTCYLPDSRGSMPTCAGGPVSIEKSLSIVSNEDVPFSRAKKISDSGEHHVSYSAAHFSSAGSVPPIA